MDAKKNGVMIAFLPTTSDWCTLDLPHMTLVYAGNKEDRSPSDFSAMAKDTSLLAMFLKPFTLKVTGLEVFGDEEKVNVLRFRPTLELSGARRYVNGWNMSKHPFNPHATIGPVDSPIPYVPNFMSFDRIIITWGDENLTFALSGR